MGPAKDWKRAGMGLSTVRHHDGERARAGRGFRSPQQLPLLSKHTPLHACKSLKNARAAPLHRYRPFSGSYCVTHLIVSEGTSCVVEEPFVRA